MTIEQHIAMNAYMLQAVNNMKAADVTESTCRTVIDLYNAWANGDADTYRTMAKIEEMVPDRHEAELDRRRNAMLLIAS